MVDDVRQTLVGRPLLGASMRERQSFGSGTSSGGCRALVASHDPVCLHAARCRTHDARDPGRRVRRQPDLLRPESCGQADPGHWKDSNTDFGG